MMYEQIPINRAYNDHQSSLAYYFFGHYKCFILFLNRDQHREPCFYCVYKKRIGRKRMERKKMDKRKKTERED